MSRHIIYMFVGIILGMLISVLYSHLDSLDTFFTNKNISSPDSKGSSTKNFFLESTLLKNSDLQKSTNTTSVVVNATKVLTNATTSVVVNATKVLTNATTSVVVNATKALTNATTSAAVNATKVLTNAIKKEQKVTNSILFVSTENKNNPLEAPASKKSTIELLPFSSHPKKFSLRKIDSGKPGPTLLVVGGIQGDEPGGFSSANILSTQYKITSGSVWIIPDLNFASILARHRGLFGDMNRKFLTIDKNDPEYSIIESLKSTLLDEKVDLILNLHDGSGFYDPDYVDSKRNPKRWGQSVIIDQFEVSSKKFSKLYEMAAKAKKEANQALVDPNHRYNIHNTNTRMGDKEMEKSLSFFAVCNGKPAFGIEASKEFTTEFRSYYHILVIESFLRQMGIGFERKFSLSPRGVLQALNSNLKFTAFEDRIGLSLDNVRPTINRFPFKKNDFPIVKSSRPLIAVVKEKNYWRVAYGNRTLTRIYPEEMEFDFSLNSVNLIVDGKPAVVKMGDVIDVQKNFMVQPINGYRVNAIGAMKEKNGTEAGVLLLKSDFIPRFSIDKSATIFRVEAYKGKAFSGMFLVKFVGEKKS